MYLAMKSSFRTLLLILVLNVHSRLGCQFLREELKYENGYEKRQKAFHRDDDMHISVRELWEIWTRSEVHNWTIEQTTDWLINFVQLPQYAQAFQDNGINGSKLPRYLFILLTSCLCAFVNFKLRTSLIGWPSIITNISQPSLESKIRFIDRR